MRLALVCVLLAAFNAVAADNARLKELFLADQAVRQAEPDAGDVLTSTPEDLERQKTVLEQIAAGKLTTSADYFHAAVVFQHGATTENIALAYSLATIATRMQPTHPYAQFLTAAAWDRLMKRMGKPQWYGTQYMNGPNGKYELYRIDEQAVTDQDRARLGVPPLAASQERIRKMNGALEFPRFSGQFA
nr:putative lipoprotein [uncultured bacterium]